MSHALVDDVGNGIEITKVFKKISTPGNHKSAVEEGFFQKTAYQFWDKRTLFACILELSDESPEPHDVYLGGDRSAFKMHCETTTKQFDTLFAGAFAAKPLSRIVLTSDTLVPDDLDADLLLGMTTTQRQLISTSHAKGQRQKYGYTGKTKRRLLLHRGSVLYGNTGKMAKALNAKHLHAIGYNHYMIIKGESNV